MKHKSCKRCNEGPCPVIRSAKTWLGVWTRERRRQMGDDAPKVWIPTPDSEAMDEAIEKLEFGTCDCSCHNQEQSP